MKGLFRALSLGVLLAATAAAGQSSSPTQRMRFTGDERVFGVVATATATVSADESFLRVTLDQGTIRATQIAKVPTTITGFRIDLAHTNESGNWKSCGGPNAFRWTSNSVTSKRFQFRHCRSRFRSMASAR